MNSTDFICETKNSDLYNSEIAEILKTAIIPEHFIKSPIRLRYSSYAIKHLLETLIGRYVSNNTCIVAFHESGFRVYPHGGNSPNCDFNIRKEDVRALATYLEMESYTC